MQGMVFYIGIGFLFVGFLNLLGFVSLAKEATFLCSLACLCFTVGSCYSFENKFFNKSKSFLYALGTIIIIAVPFLKVDIMQKLINWMNIDDNTILFLSIGFTFLSIGISEIAEGNQRFKTKQLLNKIHEQLKKLKSGE